MLYNYNTRSEGLSTLGHIAIYCQKLNKQDKAKILL